MDKDTKNIEEKEVKEVKEVKKTAKKEQPTKKDTKTTTKKNTKKPKKKEPDKKPDVENVVKDNPVEKIVEKITQPATKTPRPKRDMSELIQVICITNTPLVYESKSQLGYRVDWDGYLSENWIEYKELVNMRGSQRAFFEQPWIICDWDVLVDLKVDHYYKNIIDLQDLDSVFKKSAEELTETLKIVPDGIKSLIVDRAFELRRKKKLDSLSVIETIEKTLNIDLSV